MMHERETCEDSLKRYDNKIVVHTKRRKRINETGYLTKRGASARADVKDQMPRPPNL